MFKYIKSYLEDKHISDDVIDYEYDTENECSYDPSCCDSICRCTVIINFNIISVRINNLINNIYKNIKNDNYTTKTIVIYCLDRLLRKRKLYDPGNWNYEISHGYYGDEIDGCFIDSKSKKELFDDLDILENKNNDDMIRYVLVIEYGYLLPILENCTFEMKKVPYNQITPGNKNHHNKIKNKILSSIYPTNSYKLPICICTQINPEEYKIIDGYHRYTAFKNQETVLILLAK
jgi:hypothetical protein